VREGLKAPNSKCQPPKKLQNPKSRENPQACADFGGGKTEKVQFLSILNLKS
jgi:hypothetical protein